MRTSTRSADSGFGFSDVGGISSHSDTELRYFDERTSPPLVPTRAATLQRMRVSQQSRYSDNTVPVAKNNLPLRGGSLDRRKLPKHLDLDPALLERVPVLCNKYVVNQKDVISNHLPEGNFAILLIRKCK